jgi:hypothetical protein
MGTVITMNVEMWFSYGIIGIIILFLLGLLGLGNFFFRDDGVPIAKKSRPAALDTRSTSKSRKLKPNHEEILKLAWGFIKEFTANHWKDDKLVTMLALLLFTSFGAFIFVFSVLPWKIVRKPWNCLTKSKAGLSKNAFAKTLF